MKTKGLIAVEVRKIMTGGVVLNGLFQDIANLIKMAFIGNFRFCRKLTSKVKRG